MSLFQVIMNIQPNKKLLLFRIPGVQSQSIWLWRVFMCIISIVIYINHVCKIGCVTKCWIILHVTCCLKNRSNCLYNTLLDQGPFISCLPRKSRLYWTICLYNIIIMDNIIFYNPIWFRFFKGIVVSLL